MAVREKEHCGGVRGLRRLIERVLEFTQQRRRHTAPTSTGVKPGLKMNKTLPKISPVAAQAAPGDVSPQQCKTVEKERNTNKVHFQSDLLSQTIKVQLKFQPIHNERNLSTLTMLPRCKDVTNIKRPFLGQLRYV